MEPTNQAGPSQSNIYQYDNNSPLRKSQSPTSSPSVRHTDDQQYEKRRQDELRRQIRLKEQELEQISSSKQRFKDRIERTLGLKNQGSTATLHQNTRHSGSPLRSDNKSANQNSSVYTEQQHQARDRFPGKTDYTMPRDNTPLRKGSRSNERKTPNLDTTMKRVPESLQHSVRVEEPAFKNGGGNAYLDQLQNDNQQLQRRLNLVVSELDRVRREKQATQLKLNKSTAETENIARALDDEDRNDKHMGGLQEEIRDRRNDNGMVQLEIKEVDQARNDAVQQLRILQAERDRRKRNSEEINDNLRQKITLIQNIEKEKIYKADQIEITEKEINLLMRAGRDDAHHVHDIHLIVERLTRERDELMSKLEQLNFTYDSTVVEISRERAQLESHNKRHSQLLTSKVIFNLLEAMIAARKQAALNEFFTYCKFDEKCHKTLKSFVGVLERCGHYQMRIGLKQWYQNALKPLDCRQQNAKISQDISEQKTVAKTFRLWRDKANSKEDKHGSLKMACERIWEIKCNDIQKEKARYFTMWRDQKMDFNQKQKSIYWLLTREYNTRRAQALRLWFYRTLELRQAVRLHVLKSQYASDQVLSIAFHQLRAATTQHRSIRLQKLRSLWKGWKDAITYRKYMMGQMVSTSTLLKNIDQNMLKDCFEAMRLHKEQVKYELMQNQLADITNPAITRLNTVIEKEAVLALRKRKQTALASLSRMANSKLYSYFNHWRGVQERSEVMIQKNFRELLCRRYNSITHQAFNNWRKGYAHFNKTRETVRNTDLVEEGGVLQTSNLELERVIQDEDRRQDRTKRTSLRRSCKIFNKRMMMIGFNRWAEFNRQYNKVEGADFVLTYLRKKWDRQAWDRYWRQIKLIRLEKAMLERAEFLKETLKMKKKRQIFNAICQFHHFGGKSKVYVSILLQKIDYWMKKRAFITWLDNRNQMVTADKMEEQDNHTQKFDNLTHELRDLQNEKMKREKENEELKKKQIHQGQQVLGNNFVRMYFSGLQRAFDKWHAVKRSQAHLENLVKKSINHYQHNCMYRTKAALQQWKALCDHKQKRSETSIEVRTGDDHDSMNKHRRNLHSNNKDQVVKQITDVEHENSQLDAKLSNTITTLIRRGDDFYFQSKLRNIFLQWASFVKRQKQFACAINNVIRKSLMQQGFDNINAFSRDKSDTRVQNSGLVGMKRMFYRKLVGDWFSRWKGYSLKKTVQDIENTIEEIKVTTEKYEKQVEKIKDANCDRGEKQITKKNLRDFFYGWKNVTKWQKAARVKTAAFKDNSGHYLQKRALKKWHERKALTMKCRDRLYKFKVAQRLIYMKAVFRAIKTYQNTSRQFCKHLRYLAEKFDQQQLQSGFQMIRNFASSKLYNFQRQKKSAAQDLASALHKVYLTRMTQNLSQLRKRVYDRKRKGNIIRSMMGQSYSRRVHEYFQRWRDQAELCTVVKDVNECGPVVEEVLEHRLKLQSLKYFMRDEGFVKHQIDDEVQRAKERAQEYLSRSIARIQHNTRDQDLYLLPKMFDRWRQFVKLRKLVGWILRNMENKLQPVKADMGYAFNKWKYQTGESKKELGGTHRNVSKVKMTNNQSTIDQLLLKQDETEDYLSHMGMQRDELVDNYMKSQRLAICLGRDNKKRGMAKAFNQMNDHMHQEKTMHFQSALKSNIDLISSLKDKIQEFEVDNESLANENEELRQFSLDGYQIAKNVQSLGNERERLSVDLADKANTIKKLLDENETLTLRLREAQENAQRLINISNNRMQQMRQSQYA